MTPTLTDIFGAGSPLRNGAVEAVVLGFLCPVAGCLLQQRRLSFVAATLPQVSTAGMALAMYLASFFLPAAPGAGCGDNMRMAGLAGAFLLTLPVLPLLAYPAASLLGRLRLGAEAMTGLAFVLAAAATDILLTANPNAGHGMASTLRGELLAVSPFELNFTLWILLPVTLALALARNAFFDSGMAPDFVRASGGEPGLRDGLMFTGISATVIVATLAAGPIVCFGLMLPPALAGRALARRADTLMPFASLAGGAAAFAGFTLACRWDMPAGPVIVCAAGAVALVAVIWRRLSDKFRTRAA